MNVDAILESLNRHQVRYLLIGGMNFMLRHHPQLTYDIDFWIEDTRENRQKCEQALIDLDAEWGSTDDNWTSVRNLPTDWLCRQAIYCLNSPYGAIDIMRSVQGLGPWLESWQQGVDEKTNTGVPYRGLSDRDMLQCQLALSEHQQNHDRIRILREVLQENGRTP